MFIRNFKLNGKLIFKIIFLILTILVLAMFISGIYRIFKNSEEVTCGIDNMSKTKINVISTNNYTNVLKTVHEDIDTYIGMKIKFTGFVYRLYDFTGEQFVLARQMIISSDMQAVIVGFLCHLNGANKYSDGAWIEVEGTITKGNYHGDIPVIEIDNIKQVETPSDEYVYPPSESYVSTSVGL